MKAIANEQENRTTGFIISLMFHAAMVLIMFLYTFSKKTESAQVPPITLEWGGGGDDAAAGEPDKGMNDDYTPPGETQSSTPSQPATSAPDPTPTPSSKPATPPPPTATSDDPDVAAVRQQKEQERKRKEEADRAEAARVAEAERQRQAAEAARQAEEAKRNQVKNQAGSAFGKKNSTGQGAGGGGNQGNGGIPTGTGSNPFGKSSGTGGGSGGGDGTGTGASIGGGLGGRKVVTRGRINDDSQKEGKVVIAVCVDADGKVVSAEYKLAGSTTSDSELKSKALTAARGYKFAASASSQECGTITFNFKLQ
ncbi:MAG: energy transducer TonB [Saprospiraceae bacterium]|nr:energy transducer TonB [Saprospiraceae bacterium]